MNEEFMEFYKSVYRKAYRAAFKKAMGALTQNAGGSMVGPQKKTTKKKKKKDPCWTGYKQVGMKKKGDRTVPNCVKKSYDFLCNMPVTTIPNGSNEFYSGWPIGIETKKSKDYGCIYLPVHSFRVKMFHLLIDKNHLSTKGIEEDPHITVRYGITCDDAKKVENAVEHYGVLNVKFGEACCFENEDYDVVYLKVDCEELNGLHDLLGKFGLADIHHEYKPHMTLAYVQKGHGKICADRINKYMEDNLIENINDCDYSYVIFETHNGDKHNIKLVSERPYNKAVYKGKKVSLRKPFRTPDGPKKFSVYVKNTKGNIVKVNFGDPNMEIKRDSKSNRSNFRSRHNCSEKKDPTTAGYWSCRMWSKKPVSKIAKASPLLDSGSKIIKSISSGKFTSHDIEALSTIVNKLDEDGIAYIAQNGIQS